MAGAEIPALLCAPFALLLLFIAVFPLMAPHFWEHNRNKAIIAAAMALPVLVYFGANREMAAVAETMAEYISFIVLIGSLFVITGGILFTGDLKATPLVNTGFLCLGAILANFIGTTGASMLLIRPLLKTNSERVFIKHIPVFFIFLVSNIGGLLTPLGDPPLFLGYLRGVPFGWNLSLWPEWLFAVGVVLAVFYIWDIHAYKREDLRHRQRDAMEIQPLKVVGNINIIFLLAVIGLIFFQVPAPYREIGMVVASALSLLLTKRELRQANKFTWGPIAEVAILFVGIFITMKPLMMLLHANGAKLGIVSTWQYFWITGGLSSFLDNAPTYVTTFSLAESVTKALGAAGHTVIAGVRNDLLAAISCGAVFMGANTYIGNGPNFMVKSIAEEQGVKVPHFFGYMLYSGCILIPIFLLMTLIFFR